MTKRKITIGVVVVASLLVYAVLISTWWAVTWNLIVLIYVTFILYGLALLYSLISVFLNKTAEPLARRLTPLLVGIFFGLTFSPLMDFIGSDGYKEAKVKASEQVDVFDTHLTLYQDETFKLYAGENYRGHYAFKHDTLWLDNTDTTVYSSLAFVRKPCQRFYSPNAPYTDAFVPLTEDSSKRNPVLFVY